MPATPCPARPGCRCPHCWGLREFMLNETGQDYGLSRTRPAHITAVPLSAPKPCNGTMTCPCPKCVAERCARKPIGGGRQPWHLREAA